MEGNQFHNVGIHNMLDNFGKRIQKEFQKNLWKNPLEGTPKNLGNNL